MKKVVAPIIITAIQIILAFVIHSLLYAIYPMNHKSIGFGLTIMFTGNIYMSILILYNYYLEFSEKYVYIIGSMLALISSTPAIFAIEYRPYRSVLLILISIAGIVSSILIKKIRDKKSSL